jgi:hypothetical protein
VTGAANHWFAGLVDVWSRRRGPVVKVERPERSEDERP